MVIRKRVEGEVHYNDGWFAELFTYGTEGIDEGIEQEMIQLHCQDTEDTPEEFQHRFPVGMMLTILTITQVAKKRVQRALQTDSAGPASPELRRSVRSKLEAAIRAQRQSWDAACEIQEITGYAGDIYAFVAETASALKDDEAIPDELVDELISSTRMSKLPPGSMPQTPRAQ